ncbi:hypothetical protein SAMN06265376_101630 [Dokdonia pacifica]|uniref:DUF2188 domain-containing protein n=2 Tax=Dokdonia pacifica TaxID=1627892 RepID=A0A238W2X4_9FLAO|nr:hypothetical protein SAMN06265376_101630 [Dokdonia pacifica]
MPKDKSWKQLILDLAKAISESLSGTSRARTWHQHVVPYENGWAVRREGNKRITSKHRKQSTAINKAKIIAKRKKADVIIHRASGGIRERIRYGD